MGDVEFERRVEEEAEAAHRRFLGDLRPWARLSEETRGDWLTTVRPLVERLAAAEGAATTWKGRADQLIESLAAGKVRAALGAAPEESALEAAERTVRALNAASRRAAELEADRDGLRVSLAAAENERAREAQRANAAEARHAEREAECQTLAEEIGREREERAKREKGPSIAELEARIVALDRQRSAALDELAKTWHRVVAAEDAVLDLEARTAGLTSERDQALSTVRRYEVQLAEVVGREAALRAALADYRAGLRAMSRELLGVEVGRGQVGS